RLFDAVEQFDRGVEHLAGQFDDPADLGAADPPFGQFDRRFDHREREAFNAVAVMFQVADFGLVHPALYPILVVIMGKDVQGLPLRAAVDRLVVPQRVVGVECDHVEHNYLLLSNSAIMFSIISGSSSTQSRAGSERDATMSATA